jgi:hypothetical protein
MRFDSHRRIPQCLRRFGIITRFLVSSFLLDTGATLQLVEIFVL